MYLPSNVVTASVIHHALYLHFYGYEFLNVNISKTMRASEKCSSMNFMDMVDNCYEMTPVQVWYSGTLTSIFQIKVSRGYFDSLKVKAEKRKHYCCHQIVRYAFAIEWRHCKCCILNLHLTYNLTYIITVTKIEI